MEDQEKKIKAIVYPNTKSPRLFKNKFLEFLTRTHPIIIIVMYTIVTYFLVSY